MTPTVATTKKQYLGRRKLLRLLESKSISTRRYIVKRLTDQLNGARNSKAQLRCLAKKLGVRIMRLEVR